MANNKDRPNFEKLDFSKYSEEKRKMSEKTGEGFTWPAVRTPGHFPQDSMNFSAEDLQDLGVIGQGSFGTVNKMIHVKSNTIMAVKRIRCTMDEGEQKQLLKELDVIIKSNNCMYIVQFFGAVFSEGDCLICMELMDISLERLYKSVYEKLREQLPEDIIGKVAIDTLKALCYLKELHIIHGDIKPSNILLDKKGHIKLCDFGITDQPNGCKPYMAPEQMDPSNTSGYDVRSDVWSFGLTLVEIATGKFPYPPWTSVFDQLRQVVRDDPPLLIPKDHPYFSIDFINFVNSCLTKEKDHRPRFNELMDSNFMKKYEGIDVDVGQYVRDVLEKVGSPMACLKDDHLDGFCNSAR